MHSFAQSVLDFWFTSEELNSATASERMSLWFSSNADFDYDIERRFGKLVSMASKGAFDIWQNDPKSALALVILLDQFPRNLYRNSSKAFATDQKALDITKMALDRGDLNTLEPIESGFLLMPFQHSESLEDQNLGIAAYKTLLEDCPEDWRDVINGMLSFAERHMVVIEKFGRFPHRNAIFGRSDSSEEREYLEGGGDRF